MKMIEIFSHLFTPKEENNYRAKALHLDFLTYYLVLALLLTFSLKKLNFSNVLGFATDISVEKLYQLTNQQRQQNNLPVFGYNDKLSSAAAQKAQDMFTKNYWAHYSPAGATPWDFILGAGYQYEFAGENLAKNFLFSQGVVDAWMNSATHRENILRSDYSEVGFAVVNGVLNGEETTLVVQMFGRPLSSSLAKATSQPPIAPTFAPTNAPQPVVQNQPAPAQAKILANQSTPKTINLPRFSFNLNLVFLIFLGLALVMDLYFSAKLNVFRISGKNIAHLIFIGFIILSLTLFSRGSII